MRITRACLAKLLGQPYHCLQNHQTFDEPKVFPLPPRNAAAWLAGSVAVILAWLGFCLVGSK
jgi:hypothetical protein